MVHRVAVGWCLSGGFGSRMHYHKADYLEEVKVITSKLYRGEKYVSCKELLCED